jgi:hypothetical protein
MDRREAPRRIITWRARLGYDSLPRLLVEGRLADIARDGLCFVSDTLFKEKSRVILVTQPPPKDNLHPAPVIEIHGIVAHSHHSAMHFRTGVQISRIAQGEAAYKEYCPD